VYGHDDDDGDHAKSRRQEAKFASLEDGILRSTALPAGTLLGALFDAFESLVDFVDAAHQATELLVVRLHQLEKIVHGVILLGRRNLSVFAGNIGFLAALAGLSAVTF